ncbi:hypothetical protein SUGI_0936550 [Cryptomeria japonica]|nr:hypothetical protein SUGI_0936550 [Cryptomeria japonica]
MEQQVGRFVQNTSQQQLEFEWLPIPYVSLVAHRVAQHYGFQSMVVVDVSSADGSECENEGNILEFISSPIIDVFFLNPASLKICLLGDQ